MPLDGCPAIQRDQLRTAEGARRERDLNTPATGLPNGRRAYHSNPLDWTGDEGLHQLRLVRSALLAESSRQIRSGSIPSWGPLGERIILTVRPGLEGAPPGFYGGKSWKSQITIQWWHTPGRLHSPLEDPFANC